MIIMLDTSTPVCKLSLIDGDWRYNHQWEASRDLAKGLLGYIKEHMEINGKTWADISGIAVFRGPGSFTGLRIGLTVLNTIADIQKVPIIGANGNNWQQLALDKLSKGLDEKIVLPLYGSEAHITKARK